MVHRPFVTDTWGTVEMEAAGALDELVPLFDFSLIV